MNRPDRAGALLKPACTVRGLNNYQYLFLKHTHTHIYIYICIYIERNIYNSQTYLKIALVII